MLLEADRVRKKYAELTYPQNTFQFLSSDVQLGGQHNNNFIFSVSNNGPNHKLI